MLVVIDTNVVLVANGAHADVADDCVSACIQQLESIIRNGTVVIDDAFRILSEYQRKTTPLKARGPGDVFVRWLLQNSANARRVHKVSLTETATQMFEEFPDPELQPSFDAPDRVFVAVAAAHPKDPSVLQAADCKWLDWCVKLRLAGVRIKFLCPEDVSKFYTRKFPNRQMPLIS